MGFLTKHDDPAPDVPANNAFGASVIPTNTPPALDVTNPLDAPAATPSPGQPMDMSATLAQATPDLSNQAVGDAIPNTGNILSRISAALAPGGVGDTMPGTGAGGRRSILDVIGGLGDAFAQAGGAPAQYGPGMDVRLQRQQTQTNNSFQNQFNQQGLEKGNIDLANQRNAQLGQVSAGLNSLYGDGSPANVAKVQAALPLFAKTMGLDQNSDQFKAFAQGMQTDPHGTISAMQDALGRTQANNSAQAQMYQLLKTNAPELAPKYLDHIVNGMPLSEKDQLSLALQTAKLHDSSRRTDAYVASKAGTAVPGSGLTPDALDQAARAYNTDGKMPQLGQKSTEARQAILNRAAEIAKGTAISTDPGQFRAGFKADAHSLQALQTQADQIGAYEHTASDNANQVLAALPKGAAGGQSPIINRWLQAGRRSIQGDPEVTRFDTAIRSFASEYAKVISGSTGGAKGATDTAQRHVDELINSSMNPSQIRATIAQMQTDMGNRTGELHNQIKTISGRLKLPALPGGGNLPTMTPQQVSQLPKGTRFRTTDGRVMVRQ